MLIGSATATKHGGHVLSGQPAGDVKLSLVLRFLYYFVHFLILYKRTSGLKLLKLPVAVYQYRVIACDCGRAVKNYAIHSHVNWFESAIRIRLVFLFHQDNHAEEIHAPGLQKGLFFYYTNW